MALNSIIRTASKVVPLAVRASTGRQCYFYHHHGSALFATVSSRVSRNLLQRSFPSFLNQYSTSTDQPLLQVIESEIKCAAEPQEAEEVPQGFPFKIEDVPGLQSIKLTREYQGETISVEVHMPDLVTGEEGDGDDNDEEKANQSGLPLFVRISKKSGPTLEFGCTAYSEEIVIESFSVKDPKISEDQLAYEGPDFTDLDENLQEAFHKYLEVRGIKPRIANFLHGYMIDKDSREYKTWLKKVQKFVQA